MSGVVFIAESIADEPYMRSGVFDAHLESEQHLVRGPRGVPIEEAIAWGRARAEVVLVRSDDDDEYLSAGARHPGGDVGTWPPDRTFERRRVPGMEHLDVAAEEPIRWELRVGRDVRCTVVARTHADAVREAAKVDDGGTGELVVDGGAAFRHGDWNPWTDLRPAS